MHPVLLTVFYIFLLTCEAVADCPTELDKLITTVKDGRKKLDDCDTVGHKCRQIEWKMNKMKTEAEKTAAAEEVKCIAKLQDLKALIEQQDAATTHPTTVANSGQEQTEEEAYKNHCRLIKAKYEAFKQDNKELETKLNRYKKLYGKL